jgi:hypothetical protein
MLSNGGFERSLLIDMERDGSWDVQLQALPVKINNFFSKGDLYAKKTFE